MTLSTSRAIVRRVFRSITSLSVSTTSDSEARTETCISSDFELVPERAAFLKPKAQQGSFTRDRGQSSTQIDPLDSVLSKVEASIHSVSFCLPRIDQKCITEVVSFLLEAQIPQEKIVSCIHRYPEILHIGVTRLRAHTNFFTEVGMKKTAIFEMLLSHPEIFGLESPSDVQPVLDFLTETLGNRTWVVDLISQSPVVLTYDLEKEIRRNIALLHSLGCDATELYSIIEAYPSILCLSIEKSIQPKIDYLLSRLPDMDIKHTILSFPGFLDMSLETHIKEKIEFFLDVLEVDAQKFATYLPHFPQIFSCEIENNIKRKIQFLCLKLDIVKGKRKNMKIVKRSHMDFMACPSLFGMSQSRLVERIEQICDLIYRNDEILDHLFITCPLLFGSTVDIEDVTQIIRSIEDGVEAKRPYVLAIVMQHPEILLRDPEEVESVVECVSYEESIPAMVEVLSNQAQFEERYRGIDTALEPL